MNQVIYIVEFYFEYGRLLCPSYFTSLSVAEDYVDNCKMSNSEILSFNILTFYAK